MSLRLPVAALAFAALVVLAPAARAQNWNTSEVRALADRAIARRSSVQADSGLRSFRARAHGFVFFLGQLGEGFSEPPKLVKSDQLALEVYWQAPGLSKQIILGRRDRRDLPTDIQYHRDHLGIVQNNFGDRIRFGDGDEVRDVPHPLGPGGPGIYDYALVDSLSIQLPERTVRVYQVLARPKDLAVAGVVGTLFIDVSTAELVRFRFSFTPAAYRDKTLEDITVVLDNGLWFGRYWLPRRQEIEIRRHTSYLELPVRMIIRGRWEIGSYEFNLAFPPETFARDEPEIVYAPRAVRDSFPWQGALDAGIDSALGPAQRADLDKVRGEIAGAVANRALTALPNSRPGFGSLSDLLHVNRVEGLAAGFGVVRRILTGKVYLSAWASYGLSDQRVKYRIGAKTAVGAATIELRAREEIQDIGDEPVLSRFTNSLMSQERGYDFGDYVRLREFALRVRFGGPTGTVALSIGSAEPFGVPVTSSPASGRYRPNPALGGPQYGFARFDVARHLGALGASFSGEGGIAGQSQNYVRVRGSADFTRRLGSTEIGASAWGGWGSKSLPLYRSFVMGGRGSLPGDSFRAWGGRYAALARLDFRFPVPFFPLPLGAFGSTGGRALFGPFVAAGWVDGRLPGTPWIPTPAVRPVAGVRLEVFQRMLEAELGVGLRDGRVGFSLDVRRDLWPIL